MSARIDLSPESIPVLGPLDDIVVAIAWPCAHGARRGSGSDELRPMAAFVDAATASRCCVRVGATTAR